MTDKIKIFIANSLIFKKQLKIGFWLFLIIGILLYGFWHLSRADFLTINNIILNDKSFRGVDAESVKQVTNKELSGLYLKFIPHRFFLLYPKQKIKEEILNLDYVKEVNLQLQKFNILKIEIEEYIPKALWCDFHNNTSCWFIDDRSQVFVKSPALKGGEFLRLLKDNYSPKKGDVYLNYEDWLNLQKIVKLLSDKNWYVKLLVLDNKNDFSATFVGGGKIMFNFKLSPEEIVDNLFTALSADDFKDVKPGNFSYIDLRYGNKIYVNDKVD